MKNPRWYAARARWNELAPRTIVLSTSKNAAVADPGCVDDMRLTLSALAPSDAQVRAPAGSAREAGRRPRSPPAGGRRRRLCS
ncbi:hypothetical protein GCM10009751_02200 [Myceligenerans crystallogenes]|uniref:Uncharacterized protein n=1 Tax=Myceligenerans crystallogenes TaxID=316335 RepID=A0ABN2N2B0_9MICO